jgi:hypothetical protein
VYENGKMRHVEAIPGMGEGRIIEKVNSTMMNYKNFCKCYNVSPAQQ